MYRKSKLLSSYIVITKVIIRGGIRTHDLLLRRQTRYPLRYTDHNTIVACLCGESPAGRLLIG